VVGIFIQGRISPADQPAEPKDGVALLALRSGATVIPAHISGTEYRESILGGFLARHRVLVRFGAPVDLSEFADRSGRASRGRLAAATRRIAAAIDALAPQVGAGRPT
jgi:1-acyl-sn-glycerol-3-phosphate acyltransferase